MTEKKARGRSLSHGNHERGGSPNRRNESPASGIVIPHDRSVSGSSGAGNVKDRSQSADTSSSIRRPGEGSRAHELLSVRKSRQQAQPMGGTESDANGRYQRPRAEPIPIRRTLRPRKREDGLAAAMENAASQIYKTPEGELPYLSLMRDK